MAIVNNPLLGEIRGKFGPGVFAQVNGKTVLRSRPVWTNKKVSPSMQAQRDAFEDAYPKVKAILNDPVKRAEYDAKCPPGYSLYHRVMKAVLTS